MNSSLTGNMLDHLKESIPESVINHHSSYYSVALEGWRRGLKLTFHNNDRGGRVPSKAYQYTLSDGGTSYRFYCARSSYVPEETIKIAENKTLAYEYMGKKGVPIPVTKTFKYSQETIESICAQGESIGYPLVVKPTNRGGGKGVYVNIKNRKDLKKHLLIIRDTFGSKRVIVERYFENGVDYRFYVMQDKALAASKSYSSNVIGDGINSIDKLIKKRNKQIKGTVSTYSRTIKINDDMKEFLRTKKLSLDSVPAHGERILLREHGTYLGDRLNVDCTDEIDPKFNEYAIKALNSIPGLPCGSVDMIINEETNEGIVNEINSKGEIMMHVFPFEGKARDIPKAIIDYYFPNVSQKRNEKFHFEFKPIKDMFVKGIADEITIPDIPEDATYIKKISLRGELLGSRYMKSLGRQAASLHLIGNIKKDNDGIIQIKVIGSMDKVLKFEEFIKAYKSKRSILHELNSSTVKKFNGMSNISFKIEN